MYRHWTRLKDAHSGLFEFYGAVILINDDVFNYFLNVVKPERVVK